MQQTHRAPSRTASIDHVRLRLAMRTAAAIATTSKRAIALGRGLPVGPAAAVWVASTTSASLVDGAVGAVTVGADVEAGAVASDVELDPPAVAAAEASGDRRASALPLDDEEPDVDPDADDASLEPPVARVGRGDAGGAGTSLTIAVHSDLGKPEMPHTNPPLARIEVTAVSTVSPVPPSAMRTQYRPAAGGFSPAGASAAVP
jgi:hypothetical protein